MKAIKPQYIGDAINLSNLADQAVRHLASLPCWELYASGKASCGRKASLKPIRRIMAQAGFSDDTVDTFLRDVIGTLRLEQHASKP